MMSGYEMALECQTLFQWLLLIVLSELLFAEEIRSLGDIQLGDSGWLQPSPIFDA